MSLFLPCSSCRTMLTVPEQFAGTTVRCPRCHALNLAEPPVAAIPTEPPPIPRTGPASTPPATPPFLRPPGARAAPTAPGTAPATGPAANQKSGCGVLALLVFATLVLPACLSCGLVIGGIYWTYWKVSSAFDDDSPAASNQGESKEALGLLKEWRALKKQQDALNQFDPDKPLAPLPTDLVVISQPPTEARVGQALTYKIEARPQGVKLKCHLVIGPPGMTVTPEGLVKWRPAQNMVGRPAGVIINVQDGLGQQIQHAFTLRVRDGK